MATFLTRIIDYSKKTKICELDRIKLVVLSRKMEKAIICNFWYLFMHGKLWNIFLYIATFQLYLNYHTSVYHISHYILYILPPIISCEKQDIFELIITIIECTWLPFLLSRRAKLNCSSSQLILLSSRIFYFFKYYFLYNSTIRFASRIPDRKAPCAVP